MIQIFWMTLWIATIVLALCYVKVRERIPTIKRTRFEIILMVCVMILLLINIGVLIYERGETIKEMNDCILFYRNFPYFLQDSEFHFVNEWCYNYFSEGEIQKLRDSGMSWIKEPPTLNFSIK